LRAGKVKWFRLHPLMAQVDTGKFSPSGLPKKVDETRIQ
jgi:hypothetical protein